MKQMKRVKQIIICLLFAVVLAGAMPRNSVEAASIKLSAKKITLTVGKSKMLKVKGTKKKVTWSSNKKKVATVNKKGKVTAKRKGTATITAKVGGKKLKCKVTVKRAKRGGKPVVENYVATNNILLNQSELLLDKGESGILTATVFPYNASNKEIMWSTSDASIVTVSNNGVITALSEGKAIITATSGGKTANCVVTVYDRNVYWGAICAMNTAFDAAKFPNSVVFKKIYYTPDNSAGYRLWLVELYSKNNFGGNSYFYVSAIEFDYSVELSTWRIEKLYKINDNSFIRTAVASDNPYRYNMGLFTTSLDATIAKKMYSEFFDDHRIIVFE